MKTVTFLSVVMFLSGLAASGAYWTNFPNKVNKYVYRTVNNAFSSRKSEEIFTIISRSSYKLLPVPFQGESDSLKRKKYITIVRKNIKFQTQTPFNIKFISSEDFNNMQHDTQNYSNKNQNEVPGTSNDTLSVGAPELKQEHIKESSVVPEMFLDMLSSIRHNSREIFRCSTLRKNMKVTNVPEHNIHLLLRILHVKCAPIKPTLQTTDNSKISPHNRTGFRYTSVKLMFVNKSPVSSAEVQLKDRSNHLRADVTTNTQISDEVFSHKLKTRLKRSFIWGPMLCPSQMYRNKIGKCVPVQTPCPEGQRKSRNGKCRTIFRGV